MDEKLNSIYSLGPDNRKNLEDLKSFALNKKVVPFIGAGFSLPACPTWSKFLESFLLNLEKTEFLTDEEVKLYRELENSLEVNRFEKMADFLVTSAEKGKFEAVLRTNFDVSLKEGMERKFHLLHKTFPRLKVTTNYDFLIEKSATSLRCYVQNCTGRNPEDLNRLLTESDQNRNCLLKIHGSVDNLQSIVLSSSDYQSIYGHSDEFNEEEPLPRFLNRLFTNSNVLFIGCSLEMDRTLLILKSLQTSRNHFAVMRYQNEKSKRVALNRRLSNLHIHPIYITDFSQIELILEYLLDDESKFQMNLELTGSSENKIDHQEPVMFVGREKELESIRQAFEGKDEKKSGTIHTITGRLFNIDGAGGIGKTTLAIEAANRFSYFFKDKVLEPFRVDDLTPMSFAMELAKRLKINNIDEPSNPESARKIVTALLKDRDILLILDNVVYWKPLINMLPKETGASFIITTRDREIAERLRIHCQRFLINEISLERFTEEEALALFERMLGKRYDADKKQIYSDIARCLGFLPIALRQAISLMLYRPRYNESDLLEKLANEDKLALLRKGTVVEDSDGKTIEKVFDLSSPLLSTELIEMLQYLAICSPGPVPLSFLKEFIPKNEIEEMLEVLYRYSWVDRREKEGTRAYELHQLVRELVKRKYGDLFQDEFIQLVHDRFTDEEVHYSKKDEWFNQLEEAFRLAITLKDTRLKDWIYDLYAFCDCRGYGSFYVQITEAVERLFPEDQKTIGNAYINRGSFFNCWGNPDEAMKLYKKAEKIFEELGLQEEIANCIDSQLKIQADWGNFTEVKELFQTQESIYINLNNQEGLANCYGYQSLFLCDFGMFEEAFRFLNKQKDICLLIDDQFLLAKAFKCEALILHKQKKLEESIILFEKAIKIFEEMDYQEELADCYGYQAEVLQDSQNPYEAMILLKKQEEIYKLLGNLSSISNCYEQQALILADSEKFDESMTLQKKAEKIKEEITDKIGLAETYGYQANIFYAQSKFIEAISLYKKQEKIYEELNSQLELADCYGSQAIILQDLKSLDEAMTLLKRQQAIYEKFNIQSGLSNCYGEQANILVSWKKFDDALKLYRKEEIICKANGDRAALAECINNQAIALEDWGKLDKALKCFRKAAPIYEELGILDKLAFNNYYQAQILMEWGKLKSAIKHYRIEEKILEKLNNQEALSICYYDQSTVFTEWGKLDEAMELLKKQEEICWKFDYQEELADCYFSQATILKAWDKLDEALDLLKKQEAICKKLDCQEGLANCYNSQSEILIEQKILDEALELVKTQGEISQELDYKEGIADYYKNMAKILIESEKPHEALNFLKKQEEICEKLGLDYREELMENYCNQADILIDRGKLAEAMKLLKKEEPICKEFGNQEELASSYNKRAMILAEWGRLDEAMTLHKKEEIICKEVGDKEGLSICYGNQALILAEWGKLDEALTLHKKEETIYEEIDDQEGLATSLWNQGLIYKEMKDFKTQAELWRKSIEMNQSISIPTDEEETLLNELLIEMRKTAEGQKEKN